MDLKAYYAKLRHRRETAHREFAESTHEWRFTLSPDAAAGIRRSSTILYAELPRLSVLEVLTRVVDTFQAPRASYQQG